MSIGDDIQLRAVFEAISQVRTKIRWKPRKAVTHLAKRIRLGHLPDEATFARYEAIIAGEE